MQYIVYTLYGFISKVIYPPQSFYLYNHTCKNILPINKTPTSRANLARLAIVNKSSGVAFISHVLYARIIVFSSNKIYQSGCKKEKKLSCLVNRNVSKSLRQSTKMQYIRKSCTAHTHYIYCINAISLSNGVYTLYRL